MPQFGGKYISILDPRTENVFVLISSVGVQRHDAFISVQTGPWTTIQTDVKPQKARGQPYRWTDRHILIPFRGFEPVACVRICCVQLRAARMYFYF